MGASRSRRATLKPNGGPGTREEPGWSASRAAWQLGRSGRACGAFKPDEKSLAGSLTAAIGA
jgi:hypothetical protein